MEYYILNSYWKKFHEDTVKSLNDVLKKAEKREKALILSTLIAAAIVIITDTLLALGLLKSFWGLMLLFSALSAEILSVVLLSKYLKDRDISRTKQTLKKIKVRFTEINEWLKELGYIRKAEIKQLTFRCEKLLEELQNEKKENISYVEKAASLFYIPTLLAVISWILTSNKDMQDIGLYVLFVFLMSSAGVAIYGFIICVYKSVKSSDYSDTKKMKCMIRDFNGVLDYCFDSKDEAIELIYLERVEEGQQNVL